MKKIIAAACAALTLTMTGCSFSQGTYNVMHEYDFAQMELVQLEPPQEGDMIAVFDTSLGEIRVVLYPEYAPNTVEAFSERVKAGYYDGMDVSMILDNMYFLSGYTRDEDGNYISRQSDEELVEAECNVNLWPFKGALMAFSEKGGYSDARWFLCNTEEETLTEEAIATLKQSAEKREDEAERENLLNLFDKFYEVGGLFGTSGSYTVFGQTYEGIEVIEDICAVPTDENGIPKQEIIINSITITEYSADETKE